MSLRSFTTLLSQPALWRGAVHRASAGVVEQRGLSHRPSWSKLRALRENSWRSLSTDAVEEVNKNGGLQLSDSCVQRILNVTEDEEDGMLRIMVEGGGCSGFQYKYELDTKVKADDKVFERRGAKVVIDELSLSFLAGSTVDYHRELIRSSFRIIDNPKAELGCSCGASFALK